MIQSRAQARTAAAALAHKTAAEEGIKASVKSDAFVAQFVEMTPAEVLAYVDAHMDNLAEARTMMKRVAVMLLLLARREYGD